MKNFFQAIGYLCIMFIAMDMAVVLGTSTIENSRHPWTADDLLSNLSMLAVFLTVFLLTRIGVYLANTYQFDVKRKR